MKAHIAVVGNLDKLAEALMGLNERRVGTFGSVRYEFICMPFELTTTQTCVRPVYAPTEGM